MAWDACTGKGPHDKGLFLRFEPLGYRAFEIWVLARAVLKGVGSFNAFNNNIFNNNRKLSYVMLSTVFSPLIGGLFSLIDQVIEDKDSKNAIKAKLQEMVLTGQMKEIEAAVNVIIAEAKGESWLQRSWRPLLMCLFGVIIMNNYIIVPILSTPLVHIPPDMWDLLKLGIGGYVVGRSVEKGVNIWKKPET